MSRQNTGTEGKKKMSYADRLDTDIEALAPAVRRDDPASWTRDNWPVDWASTFAGTYFAEDARDSLHLAEPPVRGRLL